MQRKIFVQLFLQGEARLNALQIPKRQLCGNFPLHKAHWFGSLMPPPSGNPKPLALAQFTNSALFFYCSLAAAEKCTNSNSGASVIER